MDEPEAPPREERPEDYVVLLAQVPERVADIVAGLDEERLAHRHAPALPTLGEAVQHLARSGTLTDALFRKVLIDGAREVDLLATLDATLEPAAETGEVLDGFARDRRRTADLLRGLPPARWQEVVEDVRLGPLTLFELCGEVGRHEAGHLTQLRNLIALLPEPRDLGPIR